VSSPGRGGIGPALSLTYDSGAGNGVFGLGWRLSTPAITRKTDKGLPRYVDDADVRGRHIDRQAHRHRAGGRVGRPRGWRRVDDDRRQKPCVTHRHGNHRGNARSHEHHDRDRQRDNRATDRDGEHEPAVGSGST
jgi:hypothetical protein